MQQLRANACPNCGLGDRGAGGIQVFQLPEAAVPRDLVLKTLSILDDDIAMRFRRSITISNSNKKMMPLSDCGLHATVPYEKNNF